MRSTNLLPAWLCVPKDFRRQITARQPPRCKGWLTAIGIGKIAEH